jgi:hypothetical protein
VSAPSQIALCRAGPSDATYLDDVVVKGVEMFRAEILDAKTLWLCCYLPNGERITWHVHSSRGRVEFEVGEKPDVYVDFDAERRGEKA